MSCVESVSRSSNDSEGIEEILLEKAARSTRLEASLMLVRRRSKSLVGRVSSKKPCILEANTVLLAERVEKKTKDDKSCTLRRAMAALQDESHLNHTSLGT